MTIPTPTIVAGIDVGKSGLDAYLEPGGQARHFANTKPGRRALRNWLVQHGVTRAAFEPTGRYHRELHQCLFDSGVVFHFVSTKFFRLFRCKAEEFFGLIHYCRKELQWRA